MPRLLIIIASTRPGRVGLPVAEWFEHEAKEHGGFELEVADLAKLMLPLLDEPDHPRLRKYTKDHAREWSAIVERADAIVKFAVAPDPRRRIERRPDQERMVVAA